MSSNHSKGVKKKYVAPVLMLVSAAMLWGMGPAKITAQATEPAHDPAYEETAPTASPSLYAD